MAASRYSNSAFLEISNSMVIRLVTDNSSYKHTLKFYFDDVVWKTFTNQTATITWNWTDAEVKKILDKLGYNGSRYYTTKMDVLTYDGSTLIGTNTYTIHIGSPIGALFFNLPDIVNTGKDFTCSIDRPYNSNKVEYEFGLSNSGTNTITIPFSSKTTAGIFAMNTSTIASAIYNSFEDDSGIFPSAYFVIKAYFDGTLYSASARLIDVDLTGAYPVFGGSGSTITYLDTNSTTTAITDYNQAIIQGHSTLQVTLPVGSLATARNGATMVSYQFTCGDKSVSYSHTGSAITADLGVINADNTTPVYIRAYDSRGNYATISKNVTIVPYQNPTVNVAAGRLDAFGESMQIKVGGQYHRLRVLNSGTAVNKGNITSAILYVSVNGGSYSSYSLTVTKDDSTNPATYNVTNTRSLSITSTAKVYVTVKDTLGTTVTSPVIEIPSGVPLFYLDSKRGSAGFLKTPTKDSTLDVGMRIDLPSNQYHITNDKSYGINLNNSDLINANSITFNDTCQGTGEGIFYPNAGHTIGEYRDADMSHWTQTYWRDNKFYLNNAHRLTVENHPTYNSWKYLTWKGCAGFIIETGSFDVAPDDWEGFAIKSSSGEGLKMDVNEILSVDANNNFKYLGLAGSNIGIFATNGVRIQYGVDADVVKGNWEGLVLEGGTYDDNMNFTTNNQVLKLDGNELICCNNNSEYQPMYYKASRHEFSNGVIKSLSGIEMSGGNLKFYRADNGYATIYKNNSSTADYGIYIQDFDASGNSALLQVRVSTGFGMNKNLTITNGDLILATTQRKIFWKRSTTTETTVNTTNYTSTYWKDDAFYLNGYELFKLNSGNGAAGRYEMGFASLKINSNYDAGPDDDDGLIIDNGTDRSQFDANEWIVSKSDKSGYANSSICGHNIGMYANSFRLQCGTDVAYNGGTWQGLTIEQGSYSGTTFTTSGSCCKLDANELIYCKSDNSSYMPGYISGSLIRIIGMKSDNSTSHYLEVGFDSTTNPAYVKSMGTYNRTTTGTANMIISGSGVYQRTTSSAKAKLDIVPAFDSVEEYKNILNIEPVKWFDKAACEINADIMTAEVTGEEMEFAERPNLNRIYGCVAEQLEEVGLGCLVTYDEENKEIAGVAYDRIPIMYIPLFKDLYQQVEDLKAELSALKGQN